MITRYRLWNCTTQKWVRNDNGDVVEYDNKVQAQKALAQVNQTKKLNPEHEDDEITISVTAT